MHAPQMEHIECCNICCSRQIETIDKVRHFCKCTNCGYIFDNPRPTQVEIAKFYSRPTQYDDWLSHEKERDGLWRRRLKKIGKHGRQGSLLDIGTGIGQFLHIARQHFSEMLGTDISTSAISIAKDKYDLDVIKGDAVSAAIPDGKTYDMITMFHVLEHVPNPKQVISKCHSLLRQEGTLIVAVPNDVNSLRRSGLAWIRRVLDRCGVGANRYAGLLSLSRITLDGSMSEIHLSHFRPSVLRQFIENSGFEVIESSLDPYYVASGLGTLLHKTYYFVMLTLHVLLKRNYYETIWITARKKRL